MREAKTTDVNISYDKMTSRSRRTRDSTTGSTRESTIHQVSYTRYHDRSASELIAMARKEEAALTGSRVAGAEQALDSDLVSGVISSPRDRDSTTSVVHIYDTIMVRRHVHILLYHDTVKCNHSLLEIEGVIEDDNTAT